MSTAQSEATGPLVEGSGDPAPTLATRRGKWAKRLGWALAIVIAPLVLGAVFLSTPIGKRFIADQIASAAPASGLRVSVGRIEGDVYNTAILHDVTLKDPKGAFLTVPEVELDWRPLAWLWSGLDIRELTAKRGRLERMPELLPGDPDAPILPDFDIRIDRIAFENFHLAQGLAGEGAQRVDFAAKVDIRKGRALIDANGALGPEDTLSLLLDAQPDGDRFDLDLDYSAAIDGPIAKLAGLDAAYTARIAGEGSWSNWLGHALVMRVGEQAEARRRIAGFELTNAAGKYRLLGKLDPELGAGGTLARGLAGGLALDIVGALEDSVFDGRLAAISDSFDMRGGGAIDLARNRVDGFETRAILRDPDWLMPTVRLGGAVLNAQAQGAFQDLAIEHELDLATLATGGSIRAFDLSNSGTITFDGTALRVPLNLTSSRVETGNAAIDSLLIGGQITGMLTLAGGDLSADNAQVAFPDLTGELTLRGDLGQGVFALAGPVRARGLAIDTVGEVTADAKVLAKFGRAIPWSIRVNTSGIAGGFTNGSITSLAGDTARFSGSLGIGSGSPLVLRNVAVNAEHLNARFDSRINDGRMTLFGEGEQSRFGPFQFDAQLSGDGVRADLVLADPYPQAGLADVRLSIAPSGAGFALDAAGASMLGPFEGAAMLTLAQEGGGQIDIASLRVFRTDIKGKLALPQGGAGALRGELALAGGGLDGAIALTPNAGGGQGFDLDLMARGVRFGGDRRVAIAHGDIDASGVFDGADSRIEGTIAGRGFEFDALRLHAFDAKAQVINGKGNLQASIAGRRADQFELKLDGEFEPSRIALIAAGEYGGRAITMPRWAVLTQLKAGGYALGLTQVGFAGGFTLLEGQLGGEATRIDARFARMPLRLADLAGADLGLGGLLSGTARLTQSGQGPATGNARIKVDGFTRSGLILSSRPVDVFAVADLSPSALSFGARLMDGEARLGRVDARISGIDQSDSTGLSDQIARGSLDAKIGYDGASEALWRLLAIEAFDLTGPVTLNARATGTLRSPRITGLVASDNLRVQSAVSGTDIRQVSARGRFAGSRLELTRLAGQTQGGGTVKASGTIDLAKISATSGPAIDIRASAKSAKLLSANGLDATITGPLRIVSDGVGGTIAGRLSVDRGAWALGVAGEDMSLPSIATREVGISLNSSPARTRTSSSWRYLIDARAPSRIAVDGLGLDSEWGADIKLRGTLTDPRIGGQARLVRGDYRFAGTRFELTQGTIQFDPTVAIDPRLDIDAEANANGAYVKIDITGNAQTPQIAFSAIPALPEEEILARLLFGSSVTSLSATDAIQLGAAVAALQGGGGGLDPIGALRRSIGLDQLRIVSADPALGRGTGVALGKNLGRRAYVELVTDGQGYSATQVEYRITSWLALLGSVTTIGRDSVLAEISRDY